MDKEKTGLTQSQSSVTVLEALPLPADKDGNFSIKHVDDLKKLLLKKCFSSDSVVLDISTVNHVDTAVLQLLCALANDVEKNQGVLAWQGVSESVKAAAQRLGLDTLLAFERSLPLPIDEPDDLDEPDDCGCPVF